MSTTLDQIPTTAKRVQLQDGNDRLTVYTYTEDDGAPSAAAYMPGLAECQQWHKVLLTEDWPLARFLAHWTERLDKADAKRAHLHAMANKPRPKKWRRPTKAELIYPAPVYEAHFDDGQVVRMSFASRDGKGWDGTPASLKSIPERRALFERVSAWTGAPVHGSGRLVDGYIETKGADGATQARARDPFFDPATQAATETAAPAKPAKLPTGRQVAASLQGLMAWLEGDGDPEALETARTTLARFQAA